ncbi:hypothetical protein A0256_22480 [Mucilaginibacter sp. PAMC 26640]|nr:hypothetical protein A0256_22480 [Mucilaginibacter sp. PAMC 26640]
MKLKTIICALMPVLAFLPAITKAQAIARLHQPSTASIRGLSVLDDKIAWVSGSRGSFAITTNGGKDWAWHQVKGFEKFDFRDVEAFSDKEAIVMSSGSPAVILKTTDGGETWQEKYRKADSVYFLDAMDFADARHGYIMGDAIKNEFLLLETKDGGSTWNQVKGPTAVKDEAAFAASGTCLRVYPNQVVIATGGAQSRLLTSVDLSLKDWTSVALPLTNGKPSRGAFSSVRGGRQTIVVGGNYAKDTVADSVAYVLPFGKFGVKMGSPKGGPAGFQSCVEHLTGKIFLSTGTSGSNITTDGGQTWRKIDSNSYNVCSKARHGSLVLLAGDKAKIGIYTP